MGNFVSGILDPFTGAKSTRQAAELAAQQQAEAARLGAQVAAFRPVGITSRFGGSQFGIQDVGGAPRVTSASYTVAPELRAIQDRLLGLAQGTALEQAEAAAPFTQRLFNLGSQYIDESPQAAQQRIFNQLEAVRQPSRLQEEQRLASSVFGRGRAGLNIGMMGQPELYGLGRAREEQRAADALAAEQLAREQVGFGTGLFGTGLGLQTQALGPLQSYLGTAQTIEELGQQPFQLGLAVGGAAQPGATAGANLLGAGLTQAAQTRFQGTQAANQANLDFLSSLIAGASRSAGGGKPV